MPYAAVRYNNSAKPYTFYTTNKTLEEGAKVIVKDKNGINTCRFIAYVKKPKFPCNIILMSEVEYLELVGEIRAEEAFENQEESGEEEPND